MAVPPPLPKSMRGIGLRAQVLPTGAVPLGAAGGSSVTLLHPPLNFSRCFNSDGEGVSAE